jgi:hypothetical protein
MASPFQDSSDTAAPPVRGSRSRLLRELIWRRVDVPAIEYFRLWESAAGPRLTGTVIVADQGTPVRLKYAVACAPDWTSRAVHVAVTRGAGTRHVKITAGPGQAWRRGAEDQPRAGAGRQRALTAAAAEPAGPLRPLEEVEIPAIHGCLDLDLAFSPSTNILPLRRLGLAIGESREMTAAWVRFPDLSVEPLAQRYTRLDERHVRYESRGGSFTADLEIDELGLVVRYPPLWERVAVGQG